MPIPCEYYAKTQLVSHAATTVQNLIRGLDYPVPSLEYLQHLQMRLQRTRPVPFLPRSREAKAWLRDEKISSLYHFEPAAQEAFALTSNTTLRPILEILIIANLSTSDIAENLLHLSGQVISEEVLEHYKHYFWNRSLLTLTEWQNYLQSYPDGKDLWLAYLGDTSVALWKVGVAPSLDDKAILDALQGDAFMRWLELRAEPNTMETAKKAARWATILLRVMEEKRIGPQALREALEDMYQVSLQLGAMKQRDCRSLLAQNLKSRDLPENVTDLVSRLKEKGDGN